MNIKFVIYTLILINCVSFALMGIDKKKSIKNSYRISERTLMISGIIFGGIGLYFGMRLFRHKTQKSLFKYSAPILLLFQSVLFLLFIKNFVSSNGIISIF